MENIDIRKAAKAKGVFLWEIAEHVGIAEFTLSRKLRRELSQAEKENLLHVINVIEAKKEVEKNE